MLTVCIPARRGQQLLSYSNPLAGRRDALLVRETVERAARVDTPPADRERFAQAQSAERMRLSRD